MMSKHPIPDAVLAQHIAVLGKTGSGKTSTEKLAVEQVVGQGFRVCVLDAVKSDWWGITSSHNGKHPGLPFRILGGPRGHVPLHSSAGKVIGQLVGSGKLPLSIIDMADFEPGGLQRFFVEFAPSLMRHVRGVVYLVVEEAHEFAPKERSGIGAENMAIHWAKKLATAGRSKGIRMIVATQRVQALHNAVLGSCETLIAHRLTTPADQEPVLKWLKANADKESQEKVAASLSSLPTGTGWVCSGEAKIFEMVAFQKFKTYDNTATPTGDGAEIAVKTAPVDQDELRSIIGEAVKEAEASDPARLKGEIARLERELLTYKSTPAQAPAIDPEEAQRAERRGFEQGTTHALLWLAEAIGTRIGKTTDALNNATQLLGGVMPEFKVLADEAAAAIYRDGAGSARPRERGDPAHHAKRLDPRVFASKTGVNALSRGGDRVVATRQSNAAADALPGPLQKIVDAIAWWRAFGLQAPSINQVAFVSGYAPGTGTFNKYRSELNSRGLIAYPSAGRMALTEAGSRDAASPERPPSTAELHGRVIDRLDGPLRKLFEPVIDVYPSALSIEQWAQKSGYAAGTGTFNKYRSSMRSLELIDYPSAGQVRAEDWLFP